MSASVLFWYLCQRHRLFFYKFVMEQIMHDDFARTSALVIFAIPWHDYPALQNSEKMGDLCTRALVWAMCRFWNEKFDHAALCFFARRWEIYLELLQTRDSWGHFDSKRGFAHFGRNEMHDTLPTAKCVLVGFLEILGASFCVQGYRNETNELDSSFTPDGEHKARKFNGYLGDAWTLASFAVSWFTLHTRRPHCFPISCKKLLWLWLQQEQAMLIELKYIFVLF